MRGYTFWRGGNGPGGHPDIPFGTEPGWTNLAVYSYAPDMRRIDLVLWTTKGLSSADHAFT